jgi:hypothetical protein
MISAAGDVRELLHSLVGRSFVDVVSLVTAEKRAAESLARRTPHPLPLRSQMFGYTQSCLELKWWLTKRTKPRNCADFPLFRPLTASLVARGELPPAVMESFD